MKNLILLIVILILGSCNEPKCYDVKRILDISPYHMTRVSVTYISKCGDTICSSEHWSRTIRCENGTFYMNDYLTGKKKYGKIK